jgi:hypothetical protein
MLMWKDKRKSLQRWLKRNVRGKRRRRKGVNSKNAWLWNTRNIKSLNVPERERGVVRARLLGDLQNGKCLQTYRNEFSKKRSFC